MPNLKMDTRIGMKCPTRCFIIAFRDYLTQHGVFATIRASRGEDIFAACGMLSTAKQQEEKKLKA